MVKESGKIEKIMNKIGEIWNFHIVSIDTASNPARDQNPL